MAGIKFNNNVPSDNSTRNSSVAQAVGSRNDRSFSNSNPSSNDPSVFGHLVAGYYQM